MHDSEQVIELLKYQQHKGGPLLEKAIMKKELNCWVEDSGLNRNSITGNTDTDIASSV